MGMGPESRDGSMGIREERGQILDKRRHDRDQEVQVRDTEKMAEATVGDLGKAGREIDRHGSRSCRIERKDLDHSAPLGDGESLGGT